MPQCGSQILICDIPIRFDTYKGCSHACSYCFTMRKIDIAKIEIGEGADALRSFISGKRNLECNWCNWDIPLHWGGLSDPFQPAELTHRKSLEALKVFAETQYPFVVSTKNKIIAQPEYLELIKRCNCVVQFSAVSPKYDSIEPGASTFEERLQAAAEISKHKRVIIRVQPYSPSLFLDVLKSIDKFHEAEVYGVVFEGIKYFKKKPGTIKLGGDFVYPVSILKQHFEAFKTKVHSKGMKFYSGENRLRSMGDDLCCCGIDGLGWKPNTANLNHFIYDKEGFGYNQAMTEVNTSTCFSALNQDSLSKDILKKTSFAHVMDHYTKSRKFLSMLLPEDKLNQ